MCNYTRLKCNFAVADRDTIPPEDVSFALSNTTPHFGLKMHCNMIDADRERLKSTMSNYTFLRNF